MHENQASWQTARDEGHLSLRLAASLVWIRQEASAPTQRQPRPSVASSQDCTSGWTSACLQAAGYEAR